MYTHSINSINTKISWEGIMSRNMWLLLFAITAVVVVFILWILHPRPDCAFSGWKKSVGVELEAAVNNLDAVKAKVGVNDSEVREFDTLLKDYALKYDAACQDFNANVCLRANTPVSERTWIKFWTTYEDLSMRSNLRKALRMLAPRSRSY